MKKIRGMCNRGIPWCGVLVIGVLALGLHSVGALSEPGQVAAGMEAENAHPQVLHTGDELITDSGSYNFYGSYGDGIQLRYGNEAVTVTAVGPGVVMAGETVVIEFMISADPEFLLRGYAITPPCALAPQEGAAGTVDGALIAIDTARPDWVMCGAPCNCICASVPVVDDGDCPGEFGDPRDPRVGWATIFASDSPLVGVGPAYMAEVEYTVSGDATGGFNFEFVDPETPEGGEGSLLRDNVSDPVFADWIGTKVLIVECTGDDQCDDGDDCTIDTCDSENQCVHESQVLVHLEGPTQALEGSTVTYEIFVSGDPCEFELRGYEMSMPCSASDGSSGSVDYVPPPVIDESHPDYVFDPCGCATVPVVDVGSCPAPPGFDPRLANATLFAADAVTVGLTPQYLGEFAYQVSAGASGTFTIDLLPGELRDSDGNDVPFIVVNAGLTIVECLVDGDCDDGDDCTLDTCDSQKVCVNAGQAMVHLEGPTQAVEGSTVTYEIFLSADPCEVEVRGYEMTMPCSAAGGSSGSVDYVPPPVIDESHPDYVFDPCGCSTIPVVDVGSCPAPPGFDPRLANATLFADDAVTVGLPPQYLGEFAYQVSAGASGTFTIDLLPSELRDSDGNHVPFVAVNVGLTIVECVVDGDCDDGDDCTMDTCDSEKICVNEEQDQVYGDICLPYDPPDGPQPDLDDILCVLDDFADGPAVDGCECDGFRKTTDLHPCPEDGGGDGSVGIDDILKVLDAFGGIPPCDDPCAG